MKLVHTSDWHVGVTLGTVDRRPDLEVAADALVDLVADVRPDLVLHTGDLFDRSLPAGEDLRFAAEILARLAAHAPVLVLAGNHDGRATFAGVDAFCAIGDHRLRLLANVDVHRPVLTWPTGDGGRLRVAAVPYLPLAAAGFRAVAEGATASGAYADRVRAIWALAGQALDADRRPGDVDVAAAHLHVAGAVLARSEKAVHVGDDAATDVAALPPVSYAAYGHIHRPQALPGLATGRYAGSMIPIDFGEAGEAKGAVVVSAEPGRAAKVEAVTLASGRALRSVRCALLELAAALGTERDAILRVEVTDTERIEQLADRVRDLVPAGCVLYQVTQPAAARARTERVAPAVDTDPAALLVEFARDRGLPAEELAQVWKAASVVAADGHDPAELVAADVRMLRAALDGVAPAGGH